MRNERIFCVVTIVWLATLNFMDRGPRWGDVVDVRTSQLQNDVCVAGNLESGCFAVTDEVYADCYVGDSWERDHCVPWHDSNDPPPPAKWSRRPG